MALAFLFAGAVVVLDQVAKHCVLRWLREESDAFPHGLPLIRLVMSRSGVAGLLGKRWMLVALWLAASAAIVVATSIGPFAGRQEAQMGLGAALGGAAGNLIDRLHRGAVVDFIDLGFWPVFNLADVAIVLGAVAALWHLG